MDSLTHILLGAAIGEATLGKKIGKKAMFWGALVASAPDIDVIIGFFMNDLDKMLFHRGWTHSILLILIISPLYGWLMRLFNRGGPHWREWTFLAFIAQITHTLLDSFTSYGTQLFLPFSDKAVSLSTISVIDPLFSLPLLTSVILLFLISNDTNKRKWINYAGLSLSCFYLLFTIYNKNTVESHFLKEINKYDIPFVNYEVKPTLFNNLLWRGIFDSGNGNYAIAYYSIRDKNRSLKFHIVDGNHNLITDYENSHSLVRLKWVSNSFYKIEAVNDGFLFSDLRFGRIAEFRNTDSPYAFSYYLKYNDERTEFNVQRVRLKIERERERDSFKDLWKMIRGRPLN